jgi:hypothetical protein
MQCYLLEICTGRLLAARPVLLMHGPSLPDPAACFIKEERDPVS